jgi:Na+/H+-dicarboxylate symporter
MRLKLHWQILIALVAAVFFGVFLKDYVNYVEWMGELFLRGLKMLVIPLIFSSIVSGIVNLGTSDSLGRLGFKTILYYLSTSTLAIIVGLIFVDLFQPGTGVDISELTSIESLELEQRSLRDVLIGIVPDNIFQALVTNELLSIIFVAIIVGIFTNKIESKHKELLSTFFNSIFKLFMKITEFIIILAPFGIFGLVAGVVAAQEDVGKLFIELSSFVGTVLLSIFIHMFITLPLLLYIFGRTNPIKHFNNMFTATLTAFSTASSAATLPLTMKGVNEKSGVSHKITNFTLPIGATVNMDGTAIYIVGVVMFIAQAQGISMGIKEQFIILLTALLTSIGTAAIPMASLVIITIILDVLGLPYELIALILPVDRILDMFRTATNIWSDSCGAVIIAKSEGEQLNV